MPIHTRPILSSLLLFTAACATDDRCEPDPADVALAPEHVEPTATPAVVEVDERPPVPLTEWREARRAGQAAAQLGDLGERIEQCRKFVEQHPDHQVNVVVLEALADALIDRGEFAPAELARHVLALARLKPESGAPIELAVRYHVKHALPAADGLAMLALARERLAQEERELALIEDEFWREASERRIAHARARTHVVEARLRLREGSLDLALAAVQRGHAETTKLVKDIELVDGAGRSRATLPTGVLEELHVLEAELRHRKGDDTAARAALGRALGVVDDLELRGMYERLRATLAAGGDDRVVTTAAQPAQEFTLKDLQGDTVRLSDYRGKVVLVTFFATWCGPCKREMPLLQKFRAEHRERGVEVLAISVDDFNSRSKIAPFLAENHLDVPVLLEQPEQLTRYNYSGVPALYVIDRAGNVAHTRTGYDPQLADKLESEIRPLVERDGESGRKLLTIEQAPAGWEVLWQRPVEGDLQVAAIAPPLAGAGGEVGLIGREGLMRWSADGQLLGSRPLTGWTHSLDATDLDGDGQREWLVGGWRDLKVLDHTGELFWEHTGKGSLELAGHRDLDGDGFQELLLKDGGRVVAMKAVPQPLWTSAPFKDLDAVHLDPTGAVVLQADGELVRLGARGEEQSRGATAPKGRTHAGRLAVGDGVIDLFRGERDPAPRIDQDLDGDGRNDVLIGSGGGVAVYDPQGQPLLRLRSHDVDMKVALGDLDGRPGAEVVLLVEHYGIVVLGKRG